MNARAGVAACLFLTLLPLVAGAGSILTPPLSASGGGEVLVCFVTNIRDEPVAADLEIFDEFGLPFRETFGMNYGGAPWFGGDPIPPRSTVWAWPLLDGQPYAGHCRVMVPEFADAADAIRVTFGVVEFRFTGEERFPRIYVAIGLP